MRERNSINWASLLQYVQFQINRQMHEGIGCSRYKTMFGREAPLGLGMEDLPHEIIDGLETEDDLHQLQEEYCISTVSASACSVSEDAVRSHLCQKQESIDTATRGVKRAQNRQAERMLSSSAKRLKPLTVGSNVTVRIPDVDVGRGEQKR